MSKTRSDTIILRGDGPHFEYEVNEGDGILPGHLVEFHVDSGALKIRKNTDVVAPIFVGVAVENEEFGLGIEPNPGEARSTVVWKDNNIAHFVVPQRGSIIQCRAGATAIAVGDAVEATYWWPSG